MAEKHEDKEELQLYELGYHLVPSLGEDDLALRVADLQKKITALGGKIHSEGAPQSFTLAYTISKLRGGKWDRYDSTLFGWTRFEASGECIPPLKEELDHKDEMVRYLLVKLDRDALLPPRVYKPKLDLREVETKPKQLEKKQTVEETKGEVSEVELDKQIEELIQ
jgi:ribosomal protein S6